MSCEPPYDCPAATGSGTWCDVPCCHCCPPCPCHTSATFTYAAGSLRSDQLNTGACCITSQDYGPCYHVVSMTGHGSAAWNGAPGSPGAAPATLGGYASLAPAIYYKLIAGTTSDSCMGSQPLFDATDTNAQMNSMFQDAIVINGSAYGTTSPYGMSAPPSDSYVHCEEIFDVWGVDVCGGAPYDPVYVTSCSTDYSEGECAAASGTYTPNASCFSTEQAGEGEDTGCVCLPQRTPIVVNCNDPSPEGNVGIEFINSGSADDLANWIDKDGSPAGYLPGQGDSITISGSMTTVSGLHMLSVKTFSTVIVTATGNMGIDMKCSNRATIWGTISGNLDVFSGCTFMETGHISSTGVLTTQSARFYDDSYNDGKIFGKHGGGSFDAVFFNSSQNNGDIVGNWYSPVISPSKGSVSFASTDSSDQSLSKGKNGPTGRIWLDCTFYGNAKNEGIIVNRSDYGSNIARVTKFKQYAKNTGTIWGGEVEDSHTGTIFDGSRRLATPNRSINNGTIYGSVSFLGGEGNGDTGTVFGKARFYTGSSNSGVVKGYNYNWLHLNEFPLPNLVAIDPDGQYTATANTMYSSTFDPGSLEQGTTFGLRRGGEYRHFAPLFSAGNPNGVTSSTVYTTEPSDALSEPAPPVPPEPPEGIFDMRFLPYPKEINHTQQNKPLIHFSTCSEGGCSGWVASNGKCIKTESSVAGSLVYRDVTSCLCNSYQDVYACKEMAKRNLYPSLSSKFPKFNYDLSKDFTLNVDDAAYKDDEGNTMSVLTYSCSVPCEEVVVTLEFTGCCMANLEILGSTTADWSEGRPVFAREVHFIAIGDGTVSVGNDEDGPCKTICNGWLFSISINGAASVNTDEAEVVNCDSVVVSWIPPAPVACCLHCLVDYSFTSLPACENVVSVAGIRRKNKKTISKKKLIKKIKDQTNKNRVKKKRNL